MRAVALVVLCFTACRLHAVGQTLQVLPFADTLISLSAETHHVDQDGNVYILATKNEFYGGSGTLIEGPFTFGSVVTKVGSDGSVVWERFLEADDAGIWQSFRPAWQIFETESSLIIPFQKHLGYVFCNATTGFPMSRAGVWEVRKSDGVRLAEKIFTEDTSCSSQSLLDFVKTDGGYSYLYEQSELNVAARTHHVEKRGDSLNLIAREEIPEMVPYPSFGFADEKTNEYLMAWRDSVRIYDAYFRPKRSIAMPQTPILDGAFFFRGAVGVDFFVVNAMSIQPDTVYGITIRFGKKSGEIISIDTTEFFQHLTTDDRGQVWAVCNQGGIFTRADQPRPVSIVQLTSSLRPARRLVLGDTFFFARAISVLNDEVVVTGSVRSDETQVVPAPPKRPARLFIFRAPTSAIPIIETREAMNCARIHVAPNPTDDIAELQSPDFPALQNAEIAVTNVLGQRMQIPGRWASESASIGLDKMSPGVYFVSVSKNALRCTMRVLKR